MRGPRPAARPEAQESVILFSVGSFKFAIAATAVKEIRGTQGLRDVRPEDFDRGGIETSLGKLRFLLERDGKTYFVVDAKRHFHLQQSSPGRVMLLSDSPTAVLVDSTDRLMDISSLRALPRAFTQEERTWYRGLTLVNDEVIPVVNPGAFLSKAEQEALRAGLEWARSGRTV